MVRNADILPSKDAEELIDFTCVTPWERLALDIELELRKWALQRELRPSDQLQHPGESSLSSISECILDPPPIARTMLSMGDRKFWLELRSALPNDTLDAHPLERLLGISESVLLMSDSPDGIVADDASDAAVLLSAMSVAALGCECSLPTIVPVGRPSSLRFVGRQLHPYHTRFTCDYSNNPANDNSLSSLIALFQNKREAARPQSTADIDTFITAKFTYDWDDFSFRLAPVPGTFVSDRRLSAVQIATLSDADPVRKIRVAALWDEFAASDLQQNKKLAGMPAETATHLRLAPSSELSKTISSSQIPSYRTPLTAPARANLRMAQAASLQTGSELPAAPVAVLDLRMHRDAVDESHNGSQSPHASHYSSAEHLSPRVARAPAPSALEQFLSQVSSYVTAEALKDDKIDDEFLTSAVAALFEMDLGKGIMVDVVEALGPNAAEMTVLERVSRLVAASESIAAAQKLWVLFLDGVEVHWEQQWIICGVPFSADRGPDHSDSLMTQKLQMLNCCVERRRRKSSGMSITMKAVADGDLGRKRVLEGVELVGGDGGGDRSVWEPYVQPHPLTTRDMVEEELKRIVQRAEGKDKSDEAEAKRQSLTLRSDMMAFKAANPDACLADFVRWFSPTDWVEVDDDAGNSTEKQNDLSNATTNDTENTKSNGQANYENSTNISSEEKMEKRRGRLSARMSRKGNMWEELWQNSEKVTAKKQEPLFHASENGRKALADLRAMPMTQVLLHLAIILGSSATEILHRAFTRPPNLTKCRTEIERARQSIRDDCSALQLIEADAVEMGHVAASLDSVACAEHTALLATSMLMKLPPTDSIGAVVDRLAGGESADVSDERDRALLIRMSGLGTGWGSVLLPERQEFIVRGREDVDVCEDRMYARISSEEFRVAFRLGLDYEI